MIHYLILAHNNFDQLELLVNKLKTNNSKIYIHIDKKVKVFPKIKNVEYIKNRVKTSWWGFSQVLTELSCIKQAYPNMKEWDHAVIISWQCFPIKPIKYIEEYINDLWNSSCMSYRQMPEKDLYKLERYHFNDIDFHIPKCVDDFIFKIIDHFYKWLRKPHRVPFINCVLYVIARVLLPKRKYLTDNYTMYSICNRMALSYKHIKWILEFLDTEKWKKTFENFKMTTTADEIFFQTILLNNEEIKDEIINKNLWYIIFENKQDNSPKTFKIEDYDKLISSDKLFARKFNINEDKKILLELNKL